MKQKKCDYQGIPPWQANEGFLVRVTIMLLLLFSCFMIREGVAFG